MENPVKFEFASLTIVLTLILLINIAIVRRLRKSK